MGVGEAVFWGVLVIGSVALVVVYVVDRIRARRAQPDPIDEQIAAAEQLCRTELYNAPVIGVPYAAVRSDGSHDAYGHMSEQARDVCIGYLETLFEQPARERTS